MYKNDSSDLTLERCDSYAADIDTRTLLNQRLFFKIANGSVTWNSKQQATMSFNTIEIEYIAESLATKEVVQKISSQY